VETREAALVSNAIIIAQFDDGPSVPQDIKLQLLLHPDSWSDRGFNLAQKIDFTLSGEKAGLNGIGGQLAQVLVRE
jgi:hypothetical protein